MVNQCHNYIFPPVLGIFIGSVEEEIFIYCAVHHMCNNDLQLCWFSFEEIFKAIFPTLTTSTLLLQLCSKAFRPRNYQTIIS